MMMNSIGGSGMNLLLLLYFTMIYQVLLLQVEAVYIDIPSSGTKCVSENIQTHTVVLAYYYVVTHIVNTTESTHEDYQPHSISLKVTSPYGNNLHHNENITHGQFAFTTSEGGSYEACFSMDRKDQGGATVSLEWKTGISAKDWDAVAKKEKIEGVELELKKLQQTVIHIHNYLVYLKDKEAKMREINESTNDRVAWLSIMSLGLCILVSALQLWYLKRFFIKKKLI